MIRKKNPFFFPLPLLLSIISHAHNLEKGKVTLFYYWSISL